MQEFRTTIMTSKSSYTIYWARFEITICMGAHSYIEEHVQHCKTDFNGRYGKIWISPPKFTVEKRSIYRLIDNIFRISNLLKIERNDEISIMKWFVWTMNCVVGWSFKKSGSCIITHSFKNWNQIRCCQNLQLSRFPEWLWGGALISNWIDHKTTAQN